jgi:replicative DNA helicase
MKEIRNFTEDTVVSIEQQIIGAVLLDNSRYHKIASVVTPAHFLDPVHAEIWKSIAARIRADRLADPVTLQADFEHHDGLKQLGGPAYLVRLAGASVGGSMISDYAQDMAEQYRRRSLGECLKSVLEGLGEGMPTDDASGAVEAFLATLSEMDDKPRSVSLMAATAEALTQIDQAYHSGRAGISYGLKSLDSFLGGLVPQDLTIIAGATSMGKTSLGAFIAHACAKAGVGVGFASLEMSPAALAMRINSIESQVWYQRMRNGEISEAEYRRVAMSARDQGNLPIRVFDARVKDVAAILSESKRCQADWKPEGEFKGFGLLVIDYFQIIRGRGKGRYEDLSEISTQLKGLAKTLNVPVVVLAQIGRGVKDRDDKRPTLTDLKDTGQLENDADNVLFCYRDHYYLSREKPVRGKTQTEASYTESLADYEAALNATKDQMEIIVGKQRMGAIGTIKVGCNIATNRFWDLDGPQAEMQIGGEF